MKNAGPKFGLSARHVLFTKARLSHNLFCDSLYNLKEQFLIVIAHVLNTIPTYSNLFG